MAQANIEEIELHHQIQSGDDIALAKLYELYGGDMVSWLKRLYPQITLQDDALIFEAVNDAFWGYFRNPGTFDTNKNTLKRFLEIAAERDLINIIEKGEKHSNKVSLPNNVELEEKFWNSIKGTTVSSDEQVMHKEIMNLVDKELAKYFLNEKDMILAKMIMQGIKETHEFIEILEVGGLQKVAQQEEVKKNKDRIKKVLERNRVDSKIKKLLQ